MRIEKLYSIIVWPGSVIVLDGGTRKEPSENGTRKNAINKKAKQLIIALNHYERIKVIA